MSLHTRKQPRIVRLLLFTLLAVLLLGGISGFILFFEGGKPVVSLEQTKPFLGTQGTVHYQISDASSGIKQITIWGNQNGTKKILHTVSYPRSTYIGPIGPLEESQAVVFDFKKEGFIDGPMEIIVEATDFSLRNWLRGNKAQAIKQVTVDTVPPRVEILHNEKYISPGGSGIVIYRITGKSGEHGVNVNRTFHPGFNIGDGRDDTYIAYFALSFDSEKLEELSLYAADPAGNSTVVPFSTVLKSAAFKKDTINVSDGFLKSKIPEFQQYYPEMQGDFIDKYLFANGTVRRENNQRIAELCSTPGPERLWRGHFNRMAGSSRAGYADHRTYFYDGKAVDQQVHLGMDIASTRRADVRAANNGIVIFAEYLGIYGNMVLVDHGQGVFSLYSHLSQINVKPGDKVDQATVLGLTGTTGMAGGDHLHFSMLVHGVFVTPKEWWDQHWIDVTIEEPILDSKF
jgi:murein DD-endopeptidase MepM/ murein hydrolase activator NlpD